MFGTGWDRAGSPSDYIGNSMEKLMCCCCRSVVPLPPGNDINQGEYSHHASALASASVTHSSGLDTAIRMQLMLGTFWDRAGLPSDYIGNSMERWMCCCCWSVVLLLLEISLIKGNIPTIHPRLHPHQRLTLLLWPRHSDPMWQMLGFLSDRAGLSLPPILIYHFIKMGWETRVQDWSFIFSQVLSPSRDLVWCLLVAWKTRLWLLNTDESPRVPWNSQTCYCVSLPHSSFPSSVLPVEADESRVIAMGSIATTCQKYPSEPRLAYTQYVL